MTSRIIDKYNAIYGSHLLGTEPMRQEGLPNMDCVNGDRLRFRDPITEDIREGYGVILISMQDLNRYCFDENLLIDYLQMKNQIPKDKKILIINTGKTKFR